MQWTELKLPRISTDDYAYLRPLSDEIKRQRSSLPENFEMLRRPFRIELHWRFSNARADDDMFGDLPAQRIESFRCAPQTSVAQTTVGKILPIFSCREEWQRRSAYLWHESRLGGQKRAEPEAKTSYKSEALYEKALKEAAQIAGLSVSQGFEDSRQRTWDEYGTCLGSIGHGLAVEEASDLDVIAFVQGSWLLGHKENCRTRMDGEKIASASAVKGVIQQIAKSYSMMGRKDKENPAKQESVRS
jgi:hypothetical protein